MEVGAGVAVGDRVAVALTVGDTVAVAVGTGKGLNTPQLTRMGSRRRQEKSFAFLGAICVVGGMGKSGGGRPRITEVFRFIQ